MITASFCGIEDVNAVIFDDEIYDRIIDDNCPAKEYFIMPDSGYISVGGYVNGEISSIFIVHGKKMHFMVLKPYRKHAIELLKESFKIHPFDVYVEIPSCYIEVVNFAKNFGFKEIKIEESAHKKNGMLYNVHTLEYGV